MDAKFQLIGFKNLNRKSDGKSMTIVTCVTECSPVDNSHGSYGMKSVDFFLPDDKVGSLDMNAINKQFIPAYELNGFGKPSLCGYTLK